MTECIDCMDSEGAFRHFPAAGTVRDQPAVDMEILRTVRVRWIELRNEEMKRRNGK